MSPVRLFQVGDLIISQFSSKQIVINMYWEINSSFKEIKKKESYGKRGIPIFKENKKRKVMGKELFP